MKRILLLFIFLLQTVLLFSQVVTPSTIRSGQPFTVEFPAGPNNSPCSSNIGSGPLQGSTHIGNRYRISSIQTNVTLAERTRPVNDNSEQFSIPCSVFDETFQAFGEFSVRVTLSRVWSCQYPGNNGSPVVVEAQNTINRIVPTLFNNSNTTAVTSLDYSACQVGNNALNVEFTANGNSDRYYWYKDGQYLSSTTTNVNTISVNPGDLIQVRAKNNCSNFANLNPNIYDAQEIVEFTSPPSNPDLDIQSEEVCDNETFVLDASSTNGASFIWSARNFNNVDIPLNPNFFTNGGARLNLPANVFNTSDGFVTVSSFLNGCESVSSTTVSLSISPNGNILNIQGNNDTFCSDVINPIASVNTGNSVRWYSDPSLTDQIASGVSPNINISDYPLNQLSSIFVVARNGSCNSDTAMFNFVRGDVSGSNNVPTVSSNSDLLVCESENVNIELQGNFDSFEWRFSDINGDLSSINVPLSSFLDSSRTILNVGLEANEYKYWYRGITAFGCESDWTFIEFEVAPEVSIPDVEIFTVNNNNPAVLEFCKGENIVIRARSLNASSFNFFVNDILIGSDNNLTSVNGLFEGEFVYTDSEDLPNGDHTIRAVALNEFSNSCGTAETSTQFTLFEIPSNYTISSNEPFYNVGDTVSISASGNDAVGFNWFLDPNLNTPLANDSVLGISNVSITASGGNISFQVDNVYQSTPFRLFGVGIGSGTCEGESELIQFNVFDEVGELSVDNNGASVCRGEDLFLTVSSPGATDYRWFSNPAGTVQVATGQIFNTDTDQNTPIGVRNLYVRGQIIVNGSVVSESELLPVSYTVLLKPVNPSSVGNAVSYCKDEIVNVDVTAGDTMNHTAVFAYDINFNLPVPQDRIKTNQLGLEFTIDDSDVLLGIRFIYYRIINDNGCESETEVFSFLVNDSPSNLSVSSSSLDTELCAGETLSFTASAQNTTGFRYFLNGILVSNISTYTTPTDLVQGVYNLEVIAVNGNGCESQEQSFSFEILGTPNDQLTTINGLNSAYCQNEDVEITLSNTSIDLFEWFLDINGTVSLNQFISGNSNQILTISNVQSSVTYYYRGVNFNGCQGALQAISIVVNDGVGAISIIGNQNNYCTGEDIEIIAGASNVSDFNWFVDAELLIPVESVYGNTAITGSSDNILRFPNTDLAMDDYIFYVQASSAQGCTSNINEVVFSVGTTPTNLQLAQVEDSYCTQQQVLIVPSALNASTYEWSFDSNFNNPVPDALINVSGALDYIPTSTGTTVYYVRAASSSGCISENIREVEIEVLQGVEDFTINQTSFNVCQGEIIEIVALANFVNSYGYFTNSSATIPIGVGSQNNGTININTNDLGLGLTTIYAQASNINSCDSNVIPIDINVLEQPEDLITVIGDTAVCVGENIVANLETDGVEFYTWYSDSSLSTIANDISIITTSITNDTYSYSDNLALNETYFVRGFNSSGCETQVLEINLVSSEIPEVAISNDSNIFCQGEITLLATGDGVETFQWFSDINATQPLTTTSGNLSEQLIINAQSLLGDYVVYLRGSSGSNCISSLIEYEYTVLVGPTNLIFANVLPSYCIGDQINILATADNANTYEFAFDSNFQNPVEPGLLNSGLNGLQYTAEIAGNTTIFVRALNNNGCEGVTNSFDITINNNPITPIILNDSITICQGEELTILVNGFDNQVRWYNDQALASEITTNTSNSSYTISGFETQNLAVGDYIIYVQSTNLSGCVSEITQANFSVAQQPTQPTLSNFETSYCSGELISIDFNSLGFTNYVVGLTSNFSLLAPPEQLNINSQGIITGIEFITNQSLVGNYAYFVKSINGNCESETIVVTFNVTEGIEGFEVTSNFEDNRVCQGDVLVLDASTNNDADSFLWYNNLGQLVNTTAIYSIPTGDLATIDYFFTVEATNSSDCTEIINVAVTVLPRPQQIQIDGDTIYCNGETIELSLSGIDVTAFEWYYGNDTNNPVEDEFITGALNEFLNIDTNFNGSLTIYYRAINDNGCSSPLQNIEIITNPLPDPIIVNNGASENIAVCEGSDLVIPVSSSTGASFFWFQNEILTLPVNSNFLSGEGNFMLDIDTTDFGDGTFTYYVFAQSDDNCRSEAVAVTFTIFNKSGDISIDGETIVCVNETLGFELSSSNNNSYQWYIDEFGNNPVGSEFVTFNNGANIQFEGNIPGNYILFYQGMTSEGCTSDIEFVQYTINETPESVSVSIAEDIVCLGDEIIIQAGGSGVTNFQWYLDAQGTILLNQDFIFGSINERVEYIPTDVGEVNLWVRGENVSGCTSDLFPISFNVLAQPTINEFTTTINSNQYIFGDTIDFRFEGANFTMYRVLFEGNTFIDWTSATTNQIIEISDNALPSEEGEYTLELSNGTCSTDSSLEIFVLEVIPVIFHTKQNDLEILNDGSTVAKIIQGDFITFSTNVENPAYEHYWIYGDGFDNIGNVATHYFNQPGFYSVELIIENIVTGSTFNYSVEDLIEVIEEDTAVIIEGLTPPENNNISLFPNPVKTELNLRLNLDQTQEVIVRIYTINGITVFVERFIAEAGESIQTWNNPLAGYATGVYVFELTIEGEITKRQIIKE